MDKLEELANARDALKQAENEKCTCSGFVRQYEGRCCCDRAKKIAKASSHLWSFLWSLINSIDQQPDKE